MCEGHDRRRRRYMPSLPAILMYEERMIGPVLDAGDDGVVGFDVFLTIEVFRCFREVSSKPHGRFTSSI